MSSIHRTGIPYLTHHWPIATGCLPDKPCWQRCWARAMAHRFHRDFNPTFHPERLDDPMRMRGTGHVVGVAFGGDLGLMMPGNVAGVLDACADRPDLHFVIPTKRPGPLADAILAARHDNAQACVIVLASVSTQADADERLPHLMRLAAAGWRVGVSVEPMLEAIHLDNGESSWLSCNGVPNEDGDCCESFAVGGEHFRGLSWVICGGESGPGARPMDPAWARALRDQCIAAGMPFAYKQGPGTGTCIVPPFCGCGPHRLVEWMGRHTTVPVLDGATWTQTPWGRE